jgi:hypothetical protein
VGREHRRPRRVAVVDGMAGGGSGGSRVGRVFRLDKGRRRWEEEDECSDGGPWPVGGLLQASTRPLCA